MSLGASFGAFAQGFAGSHNAKKDRAERRAVMDQNAKLIDILGQQMANGGMAGGLGAAPDLGYGSAAPAGGSTSTGSIGTAGGDFKTADERDLLARTIQAEAGGEGYDGMLAVGAVIGNRAKSGKYGGSTLRDVIMAPGQFSAWNGVTGYAKGEGALNMDRIKPSEHALRVADQILAGQYNDPTGGATHYYNPAAADPKWGRRAGGPWQKIGNHIFGFADGRPGGGNRTAQQQPQRTSGMALGALPPVT
ncbi:cell wall hydrolase [Paracoccus sp. SY]|uniref:cell wall hydrolase n=1 Tax=Paracoccus sp. SY TaxID=1330255 RepID=UPI000CD0AB91|nr:cell wall hydrolase [Paracoccus sp. SY]